MTSSFSISSCKRRRNKTSQLAEDLNIRAARTSYMFRCFVVVDSSTIKKEPQGGHWNTLKWQNKYQSLTAENWELKTTYNSLTVRLLQLAHLCCHFDSEVDFIRVLTHNLQLDVLGTSISRVGFLILSSKIEGYGAFARWRKLETGGKTRPWKRLINNDKPRPVAKNADIKPSIRPAPVGWSRSDESPYVGYA